jgi:methylated-DNA-[protein]-cysteine S-methyltransferase
MEYTCFYSSPLGLIELKSDENSLISLYFKDSQPDVTEQNLPKILEDCLIQLDEYFKHGRKEFSLNLNPDGTEFQKKVWKELQVIPYSFTISYIELAQRLGDKNLTRAVGSANGKNPISIIIPCHRVIGANNKLIGYGGGLWRKKWLLDFEKNKTETLLLDFEFI